MFIERIKKITTQLQVWGHLTLILEYELCSLLKTQLSWHGIGTSV